MKSTFNKSFWSSRHLNSLYGEVDKVSHPFDILKDFCNIIFWLCQCFCFISLCSSLYRKNMNLQILLLCFNLILFSLFLFTAMSLISCCMFWDTIYDYKGKSILYLFHVYITSYWNVSLKINLVHTICLVVLISLPFLHQGLLVHFTTRWEI